MAQKEQDNEVRKEFGKWFMDIAKYTVTAVIISACFGEISDFGTMIAFAALAAGASMFVGYILLRHKGNNKNKQTKRR